MKKVALVGTLLMMGVGNAIAACPGAAVDAATVLSGKGISDGTSNEVHCSNGDLVEIAEGVGHPVDPTHVVGTWSANGSDVTYNYNGGDSFTFTVRKQGADYNFCRGGNVDIVSSLPDGNCAGAVN